MSPNIKTVDREAHRIAHFGTVRTLCCLRAHVFDRPQQISYCYIYRIVKLQVQALVHCNFEVTIKHHIIIFIELITEAEQSYRNRQSTSASNSYVCAFILGVTQLVPHVQTIGRKQLQFYHFFRYGPI